MREQCFSDSNGARNGFPRVGFLITSGNPNNQAEARREAQAARDAGISLFTVGISNSVSSQLLRDLSAASPQVSACHILMCLSLCA